MFVNRPNIRLRKPGKLTKTTYANEIAAAVNAMPSGMVLGDARPDGAPGFEFIGKIVSTGPQGSEADFGDERYWVQIRYILKGTGLSAVDTDDDGTLDSDEGAWSVVMVTNLAGRLPDGAAGEGRHDLPLATLIRVDSEVDEEGAVRYYTFTKAPDVVPVNLTTYDGDDGTRTTEADYRYTAEYLGTSIPFYDGQPMEVLQQRPRGKLLPATLGLAVWVEINIWAILICDEEPNYTEFTVVTDVACDPDTNLITKTTDTILTPIDPTP